MTRCPICWDDMIDKKHIHTTKCGHIFHYKCILKWISHKDCHFIKPGDNGIRNTTCPNCRGNIEMVIFSAHNHKDFNVKGGFLNYMAMRLSRGMGLHHRIIPI